MYINDYKDECVQGLKLICYIYMYVCVLLNKCMCICIGSFIVIENKNMNLEQFFLPEQNNMSIIYILRIY
jgi:hypothetical protein